MTAPHDPRSGLHPMGLPRNGLPEPAPSARSGWAYRVAVRAVRQAMPDIRAHDQDVADEEAQFKAVMAARKRERNRQAREARNVRA